jgi:hypothetical protein
MNGYLLLAIFEEDFVPMGLYRTRQEVDQAALLLDRESALELNRKVFMDDDDLGRFCGAEAVRFQDGKPISIVGYPKNRAENQSGSPW